MKRESVVPGQNYEYMKDKVLFIYHFGSLLLFHNVVLNNIVGSLPIEIRSHTYTYITHTYQHKHIFIKI